MPTPGSACRALQDEAEAVLLDLLPVRKRRLIDIEHDGRGEILSYAYVVLSASGQRTATR